MGPTERNHTNPCFWMALWNPKYYDDFIDGRKLPSARKQKAYSLDFRSPAILYKKIEDLHFERGLGLVLVDDQEFARVKNEHPCSEVKSIGDDQGNLLHQPMYVIDIENTFTALEKSGCYDQVLETVKTGRIDTLGEKTYLASFVILHVLRSKTYIDTLCNLYQDKTNPKLEAILHLNRIVSSADILYGIVRRYVNLEFSLYSLREFTFPLSDNPIIRYKNCLWVTLSPKHLLVIDLLNESEKVKYPYKISTKFYREFCQQVVLNTNHSILFCYQDRLEDIKNMKIWKDQKSQMIKNAR